MAYATTALRWERSVIDKLRKAYPDYHWTIAPHIGMTYGYSLTASNSELSRTAMFIGREKAFDVGVKLAESLNENKEFVK